MAPKSTVSFELVESEVGLWCLDCLTSGGVVLWFTTTTNGRTSLRSKRFCRDCQGNRVEAN